MEESRVESKHSVLLDAGVRRDSRNIGRLLTCEGDQGEGARELTNHIISYTVFLCL